MGKGKARRRRQANYEASHSSGLALAPPPSKKDVNAVPSKLRQIMKFIAPGTDGHSRPYSQKSTRPDEPSRNTLFSEKKKGRSNGPVSNSEAEQQKPSSEAEQPLKASESEPKKKRKRSHNSTLKLPAEPSDAKKGMRERRKSFLKEKKEKKKKHKKQKLDADDEDDGLKRLYQQETVPFGEVVDAPPKLPKPRKAPNKDGKKPGLSLSQERIRLQAMEAYRKKRGWESRPGLKIPV